MKHDIEIVVDNSRTHTKQTININEFSLKFKPGFKSPDKPIEYYDHEKMQECTLELYFEDGPLIGKSKGLKAIAEELGYDIPEKIKLKEIKSLLVDHPAFKSESKLEALAKKYIIKIIYCPKYHCELNPFEEMWCWMKWYIRKYTDQRYPTMLNLINQSRIFYQQNDLHKN